jgi:hypothetical protein
MWWDVVCGSLPIFHRNVLPPTSESESKLARRKRQIATARWLVNDELERMWMVVAQFKVRSWLLPRETEKTHETMCQDS